ncbi:MAG: hypothetical protein HXS41_14745 [Theionarchaea archaeon]|nr:hypothetical protein [Theionarchaea archaeon]MBU7022309.1 hypothetical protein [Theionarchaea archaeon]MBU7040660.1 hypothetical protein [Theionarchaea archaeon]
MNYTMVKTESGYRIFQDRIPLLDGMQLRFLYDVQHHQVFDTNSLFAYFGSLEPFEQLTALGLITLRPHRVPSRGEKVLIQWKGTLFYAIQASVFRPEVTEKGICLLRDVKRSDTFSACMEDMDQKIAERLLGQRIEHD